MTAFFSFLPLSKMTMPVNATRVLKLALRSNVALLSSACSTACSHEVRSSAPFQQIHKKAILSSNKVKNRDFVFKIINKSSNIAAHIRDGVLQS